jgi:hypothetical protein
LLLNFFSLQYRIKSAIPYKISISRFLQHLPTLHFNSTLPSSSFPSDIWWCGSWTLWFQGPYLFKRNMSRLSFQRTLRLNSYIQTNI